MFKLNPGWMLVAPTEDNNEQPFNIKKTFDLQDEESVIEFGTVVAVGSEFVTVNYESQPLRMMMNGAEKNCYSGATPTPRLYVKVEDIVMYALTGFEEVYIGGEKHYIVPVANVIVAWSPEE